MPSKFHERLRAARETYFPRVTQRELAALLGITRSGYAFYEDDKDGQRVPPNVDQVRVLADRLKVPLDWLLDDKSEVGDVYRWRLGRTQVATVEVSTASGGVQSFSAAPVVSSTTARLEQTFWRAVEYEIIERDHTRVDAFDATIERGSFRVPVSFLQGRTAVQFVRWTGEASLQAELARLLLAEKLFRKPLGKHLVVWAPEGEVPERLIADAETALSISIAHVTSAAQAADYVSGL
jgi:transcriptional regulator with XRE-family HTH domain